MEYHTVLSDFMPTTIEPKAAKPRRVRTRRTAIWQAHSQEPGIQISLRLHPEVLAKLQRLADTAVQSKSQFVTKWILGLPD